MHNPARLDESPYAGIIDAKSGDTSATVTKRRSVRIPAPLQLFVVLFAGALFAAHGKIPNNPSSIHFDSLKWQVPRGEPFRVVLGTGLVAYIAEDQTLPLLSISGYVRYGRLNDPRGKEGLCSMLAALMRTGGTQKYQSDSLDALLDLYAIKASISAGETQMEFNFSCLSDYSGLCLDVIQQMLFYPVFEEKKIAKTKDLFIEDIYHRFDNPGPVLQAAYEKSLYSGNANSRFPVVKSIQSITRNDLVKLHESVFRTENMLLAAAGKFVKDTMVRRLNGIFPKAKPARDSVFPAVNIRAPVKLTFVKKPLTQSYVKLGLPLFKRPHPDYYAVSVLNVVLGGGSLTSRLGSKIRSDEGLAYDIHSSAGSNYFFPSTFSIEFNTKSESTCRAISLALAEVDSIRKSGITAEELDNVKKRLIDGFPSDFRRPEDIVENYLINEYWKRPADHLVAYPGRIKALTLADIKAVAEKYLDISALTYVVVGDSSAIFSADTVAGFSLKKLAPARFIIQDSIPMLP